MIEAFRREGLGVVLDIVPNHMGVGGADNPLWLDVLEWGPESRYAGWFDIDWSVACRDARRKLLAPVLGEQYGEALRSGKTRAQVRRGRRDLRRLGLRRAQAADLAADLSDDSRARARALDRIGDRFLDLPNWRPQIAERAAELEAELAALARDDAGAP